MSPTSRGHLVYKGRKVLLKYHRLLSGLHSHPPNSVAALAAILAGGAEVVEFDVHMTRDAAFVLLHDATLERETTGQGPVRAITLDAFQRLRLRHSDEPPAGLAEAVDGLRDVRRPVKVQVDLKVVEPISAEVGAALIVAEHCPTTSGSAAKLGTGGVLSITVIVCASLALLPAASVAVKYRVMSTPAIAINGKLEFLGVPREEALLDRLHAVADQSDRA